MSYDDKINELKIKLPEAKPPVGNYVATKVSGKIGEGIHSAGAIKSGFGDPSKA